MKARVILATLITMAMLGCGTTVIRFERTPTVVPFPKILEKPPDAMCSTWFGCIPFTIAALERPVGETTE